MKPKMKSRNPYNPYTGWTMDQFNNRIRELKKQQKIAISKGDSAGINRIGYALQEVTNWMNKSNKSSME